LQPVERLTMAAARDLRNRLDNLSGAAAKSLVADAAMRQPADHGAATADTRILEDLARTVVDAVLKLAGQRLDAGQMSATIELAARKHLMTKGIGAETQRALLARLAGETPYLVNLPRLAELASQGLQLPPAAAAGGDAAPEIVGGQAGAFAQVLKDLAMVAETDLPVLLWGETGTGKELLARRLHQKSARREGPFVPVNCAALADSLLESELFGHEKGAFTGAAAAREGYLQAARGGTLFLDEIGETTSRFQVRLLRVLEDGMVTPVGGRQGRRVDFRLVTASHRDLEEAARQGDFSQALLYRILVVPLKLPPLRRRPEDLPALIDHFLAQACVLAKRTRRLAPDTRRLLMEYHWPGNVRQLSHLLQRLVALATEYEIGPESLPEEVRQAGPQDTVFFSRLLAGVEGVPAKRQAELARLLAAAGEGEISNKEVREALACSDSTAKNLLRALVEAGMLEARGRRGGRRYKILDPEEE